MLLRPFQSKGGIVLPGFRAELELVEKRNDEPDRLQKQGIGSFVFFSHTILDGGKVFAALSESFVVADRASTTDCGCLRGIVKMVDCPIVDS